MNFKVLGMIAVMVSLVLFSEMAHAVGSFETKMERLRDSLVGTLLPLISTIGLVYASILAVSGSEESRGKVISIIIMSIVGFMAQYIIEFVQGIAG